MKIRNKLLVFLFTGLFLITMIETVLSNRILQDNILKDKQNEYSVFIRQLLNIVNLTVKETESSFLLLYNSTNFITTVKDKDSPATTRERNIKSKLRYICFENPDISSAAFVDAEGKIYSAGESTNDEKNIENLIRNNSGKLNEGYTAWLSDDDGSIYLKKNIYAVTPLYYCGYLVAKMVPDYIQANTGFNIAKERNGSIALFTNEGQLVFTGGTITRQEAIDLYDAHVKDSPRFDDQISFNGTACYLHSNRIENSWIAFLVISMDSMQALPINITRMNVLVFLIVFLALIPLILVFAGSLTKGIKNLYRAMSEVSSGRLDITIPSSSKDEIGELTEHFQWLINKLRDYMAKEILHATEKKQAEYAMLEIKFRALQSQINPHFISNVLTAINAQATLGRTEQVGDLSVLAGRYFRENLRKSNEKFAILEEEIQYVKDYLDIFRSVYGDHVIFIEDVPKECMDCTVPNLILQPLVENTLIHGGLDLSKETYEICLTARLIPDASRIQITLTDNGKGIPEETLRELQEDIKNLSDTETIGKSFGLRGVFKRLYLLYGDRQDIVIQSPAEGIRISFSFPTVPNRLQ